ncbi:ATP-binding protein [Kibdelosporangium philippinense]|uniref:histidine kinase n=1 Tax=Kibdelosporangium philippinense TaxID=211113 RepID=A0ABS8Z6P5_9PSEU|nr:ATP-binding protein [Kibdelosporangium philippinense]MCE7001527.1 ATP-binding protein [Kibdelosporangium philippinense]
MRFRNWPTGVRSAVAAGLIALVLFTAGALWLRLSISGLDDDRHTAQLAGAQAIADSVIPILRAGKDIATGEGQYEVVHSDGRVLGAGREIRSVEDALGRSVFPPPTSDASGGQVFRFPGVVAQDASTPYSSWPPGEVYLKTIDDDTGRIAVYVYLGYSDPGMALDLDTWLWPGVPAGALLVALVAWASAASALRPVEWIRVQAADISTHSLEQRVDVPVRWMGMSRLSIGVRAGIAAALMSAGPLVAGVVWLRHAVDDVNTARFMAESSAAYGALDGIELGLRADVPIVPTIRDSKAYLYEVVYSDGHTDSSPAVTWAESIIGRPLLAAPLPNATAMYATDIVNLTEENRLWLRSLLPDVGAPVNVWKREVGTARGTAAIYTFEVNSVEGNPAVAMDRVLFPAVPASMALIGLAAWSGTTRSLRPVERIREQAGEISTSALDLRVPVPATRDAISRLALTLNEMLDRLENSVKVQRQFIADAAHELRSPIASLRTVLEVARDHPDQADWLSVIGDAVTDTRRLEVLAEDLLLLARLDSALPLPTASVDLSEVADGYRDRAELTVDGSAFVKGDVKQLDRLLRNLVDNAARHAVSRVSVAVRSTEDKEILEVADDGPGIPAADRERVFDRFTRLDEARDSDAGGAGLGLAIAREIAVRHGGTLTVGDHAVFTASFPKAASS